MTLLAYALSVGLGWLIANLGMQLMYWSIGQKRQFLRWIDFWLGGTERAVATTLVIWAPGLVPAFVGGWIVLKIAANWQRRQGPEHGQMHLAALVGSVLSFSVAIGAGLLVSPQSLEAWSTHSN